MILEIVEASKNKGYEFPRTHKYFSEVLMTAKEYLSQAYKIDNDINSKLEQVASLRDLATKATSTMSDMPGSPNRNIHKMEDAIVKIIALEDEINSDIHELISLKADITHMIKRVANRAERTILEKRYLCFDTWEQISVDMGYSIQHTFRLHDKALKEIDGFLKVES